MRKRIEYLFPEISGVFGDQYNMTYLQKCSSEIEIISTSRRSRPAFADVDVDMIYLDTSTERMQEIRLEALRPYVKRIRQLIDAGTIFLLTGNAVELIGTSIEDGERTIPALGLWDFRTVRRTVLPRQGFQFAGCFDTESGEEITVLGQRSQYSAFNGDFARLDPWINVQVGAGMNSEARTDGIRKNHFFATDALGPLLVLNPQFCKYLFRLLGLNDHLPFEQEALEAHECRKRELFRHCQVL